MLKLIMFLCGNLQTIKVISIHACKSVPCNVQLLALIDLSKSCSSDILRCIDSVGLFQRSVANIPTILPAFAELAIFHWPPQASN